VYRFLITDTKPKLIPCTYQDSVRSPGKTICINENGKALVVEPSGEVRDLRDGEEADSPWCWADACGDLLVYRTDPAGPSIVAFRMVKK